MSGQIKRVKSLKRVATRIETQFSKPPQTTALQKLFILLGAGIFVALASLTASLPLPLPSHQSITTPYTINGGDTAWMLVATIFAFCASPAATYLFANLYNIRSPLAQTGLLVTSIVTFLWIIITFALIYGKETWDDRLLGFPIRYYMFAHLGGRGFASFGATTIPSTIFAVFELSFAILAPIIVAAAVADRVAIYGFVTFIIVWHVTIYAPIAFITWNQDGWLHTNYVQDFSGGIVVNQLAAITILVLNFFLDWKQAPKRPAASPNNKEGLLLSALAFWFLSFGLNAGKAHAANSTAAQSVVNTIASVFTSIFFNYLWDEFFGVTFSATEIVNAIMIGLISATPSSGFVTVGGSMVIAIITVLVVRIAAKLIFAEGNDDVPLSFSTLYGVGGTISFIFTALITYRFVNPDGYNGLTHGFDGSADSIRYHTATVLVLWPSTAIAVALCAFICDLIVPLKREEQTPPEYTLSRPSSISSLPRPQSLHRPQSVFLDTTNLYRQSSTIAGSASSPTARDR